MNAVASPVLVRLAAETDFAGWRAAARALREAGVEPERVVWTVDVARPDGPPASGAPGFSVPREFLALAERAIRNRSDARFDLLYRLLWRLSAEPQLVLARADPDVAAVRRLAADVDAAVQKMKAFVRFTPVVEPDGTGTYVAWFEPAQRVTEEVAPFFVRRVAGQPFAILTPDACALWNGRELTFTPGVDPADAPGAGGLEGFWAAMRPRLLAGNRGAAAPIPQPEMARAETHEPGRRAVRAAHKASRDAPYDGAAPTTLEEVWAGVDQCRRCDLWRCGNGVAGEGPRKARLMFVGEQPGDQEEQAVKPFVGPAGQMLDKALAEAGVPRAETFVTNAVKHFKHEMRGKKRLHKTPNQAETVACRWWLDAERRIVRPRVIVALGATAAFSVFGKPMPIGKSRQQAIQLPDQAQGVVTYHPSYLLRVPDEDAKAKAYALFVEDLKFAWKLAG